MTDKTSAEMLSAHIAGRLIADGGERSPRDVVVQIFARQAVQESFIAPAVAEPLIVWILTGSATVEERDIGGDLGGQRRARGRLLPDRFGRALRATLALP